MENLKRCGQCENCQRVAGVRHSVLKALTSANIQRITNGVRETRMGDDARLIWNRTIEENPCTNPQEVTQ